MIEPIDFSRNENEYLTSDFKQQVLAFSILWAVFAFSLSAWVFLGKKVGPASLILDRRQAEGRVVETSSRGGSTAYDGSGFSSRAPIVRPYQTPEKSSEENWSHLSRVGDTPLAPTRNDKPVETEKPEPVQVQATAETAAAVPLPTASRPRPAKRPQQIAEENPDRLLYPVVSSRPQRGSLGAVGRAVERSMIRMVNLDGVYHVGMILDSSGKALISDAFVDDGSIGRIAYGGTMMSAELLGRDAEYGLALIQLPAGNYPTIPLSPDPPARGEELLAFGPTSSRAVSTTVRAGVGFGQAGYLVEGFLGNNTWGTPLLNDRGELVGCNFGSVPDFPGSGVHLAADSAAIYRLLRGYKNDSDSAFQATLHSALARLTSLAGETRDEDGVKKGRIMARVGVSQFFIGMSTSEAGKWVSSPTRSTGEPGVEIWDSKAPPMRIVFVNDRLVAVATDFTGFSTVTGLSMGARIDTSTLRRTFERFLLVDGLALTPGLDILLDREGKATQFVVRPEL